MGFGIAKFDSRAVGLFQDGRRWFGLSHLIFIAGTQFEFVFLKLFFEFIECFSGARCPLR